MPLLISSLPWGVLFDTEHGIPAGTGPQEGQPGSAGVLTSYRKLLTNRGWLIMSEHVPLLSLRQITLRCILYVSLRGPCGIDPSCPHQSWSTIRSQCRQTRRIPRHSPFQALCLFPGVLLFCLLLKTAVSSLVHPLNRCQISHQRWLRFGRWRYKIGSDI